MDSNVDILNFESGEAYSPDLTTEQGIQEAVVILGKPVVESLMKDVPVEESKQIDHLDTPEVNNAALNFQNSMKTIKQRTRSLSKKSMERVFDAVLEFPLSAKDPVFRNKIEHELFILALNAMASKTVMMSAVMKDHNENLEKIKQAEEAVSNVEGEING